MALADEIISLLPQEMGFKPMTQLQPPLYFSARTIFSHLDPEAEGWVTDEDPRFLDPAHGNFGLRYDSPIFTRIPDFEPIPAVMEIKAKYPKLKILIVSAYDDETYVVFQGRLPMVNIFF